MGRGPSYRPSLTAVLTAAAGARAQAAERSEGLADPSTAARPVQVAVRPPQPPRPPYRAAPRAPAGRVAPGVRDVTATGWRQGEDWRP